MPATPRPQTVAAIRLVAFGLLALGTLSASGCARRHAEQVDPAIFTWSGAVTAPATVKVRNTNGAITVRPADGSTMQVTASARWRRGDPKKDLKFMVIPSGNDVTVCVIWSDGRCSADAYVAKPSFFGSWFHTSGTDAKVDLVISVPATVKVDAFTANGNVDIAATAPVKVRDINGSVRVATAIGPVDAETVNGSVDARMTTLSGDGPVRAQTMNGTAAAYLPATFDGSVKMEVMNGRIGNDFGLPGDAGNMKSMAATVGTGGRLIEVKSVNGSAFLRKLNADGTIAGAASATPVGTEMAPVGGTKPPAARKGSAPKF